MASGLALIAGIAQAGSDDLAAIRADVEFIAQARNQAVAQLAEDYQQWEANEPGRSINLVLTGAMLRRDLNVQLRRWGGQWLPGFSLIPTYNRSRNRVDASGLMLTADRLQGTMTLTLVSDGFVPPPGTTINLEFELDARLVDGKWIGTYRAKPSADCRTRVPSNRVQYEATLNAPIRNARDNPKAVAALLPQATIEQVEHWGELSGVTSSFAYQLAKPAPTDSSNIQDAVALEQLADRSYRELRATMLARKLWISYAEALTLAPISAPVRSTPAEPDSVPAIAQRLQWMRSLVEAGSSWEPTQVPCPMGKLTTEDPWFAGIFHTGALTSEPGRPNIVPAVDPAGRESWRHVEGWRVAGPVTDRRDVDTLVPLPECVPDGTVALRLDDGASSKTFNWQSITKYATPQADVGTALGDGNHQAGYLYTELHSDVDQSVWIAITPDDFCRLWLNDRLVWANWDPQKEPAVVQVSLKRGRNPVLVRCANDTHSWGVTLQVCLSGRPRTVTEQAATTPSPPLETSGWFGPGHDGVYAGADPVIAWDVERGINVLWRLPFTNPLKHNNKSISTPQIVGDKVITQCEPHRLICVDKMTGRILWERDSNILEFIEDPEERRAALADYDRERSGHAIVESRAELDKLEQELAEISVQLEADQDNEELRAHGEAVESKIEKIRGGQSNLRRWSAKIKDGGVVLNSNGGWFGGYVGFTASTPVIDGQFIYVKYGTGVAACYDLDGNRQWMVQTHFYDQATTSMPSPMLAGDKLIIVGSANNWSKLSTRPRLPELAGTHKDNKNGGWMIALDKKTGKLLWDAGPIRHAAYGICATPLPMQLTNDRESMWVIVTNKGQLLRADDGHLLLNDFGVKASFFASPVAVGNTIYFTRSGHIDAVELRMLDRETVGVRSMWTTPKGGNAGIVVRDGLVYGAYEAKDRGANGALGYVVKDAATGHEVARIPTVLPGGQGFAYTPIVSAGKYVFASAEYGIAVVQRGRKPLVMARMPNKERMIAQPAFDGNRMYLRTYQSLMCIGLNGKEGAALQQQAEINAVSELIPYRLVRPSVINVRTRFDGTVPAGLPAWELLTGAMPTNWLMAGPFPIQETPAAVAALAGPTGDWPVDGQEIQLSESTGKFTAVSAKEIGNKGIEVTAAGDPPGGSDRLFYTVLDNRVGAKFLTVELTGAEDAIIGGEVVRNGETLQVDGCGLLPIFVRVRFAAGLPPFMQRSLFHLRLLEVEDPFAAYQAKIGELRESVDLLERIPQMAPGSRAATRAEEALAILKLEQSRK